MKLIIFLIFSYTYVFAQNWWEVWPNVLTEDNQFYRGQNTKITKFDQVIQMILNSNSSETISSRFTRTLKGIRPNLSNQQIKELADKQRKYWIEKNIEWDIAICHADPYMCYLPSIKTLMANIIKPSELPIHIKEIYHKQVTDPSYRVPSKNNGSILEFFDPIVSTSYLLEIAQHFARDKEGYDGYVLILNDRQNRNCSKQRKKTANCFIETEEFMEEIEFPLWGYATAKELDGIIVDGFRLSKDKESNIELSKNELNIKLNKDSKRSCRKIKKLKRLQTNTPKEVRFLESIQNNLNCKKQS